MKKLHKGFTLVELIVVIAIIGILAAILVPALMGYIKDSKLATANATAKTVYTALNNYCEKCMVYGTPVSSHGAINFSVSSSHIGQEPTSFDGTEFNQAVGSVMNQDAVGSVWSADFAGGFPTSVIWQKSRNDVYVGRYPNPATATGEVLERSPNPTP